MAWLAIDDDGQEALFSSCPRYNEEEGSWIADDGKVVELPKGSIKKLIGKNMEKDDVRKI